ncbi:MAG: hypothetical protein RIS59_714 [Pseudomonadota bacterium]|jgi:hypothetical protein
MTRTNDSVTAWHRSCGLLLAMTLALLGGCTATQMDTPSPSFGKALNAAKDAQRIDRADRDDGLRPLASELPEGVMPSAPASGYGKGSGQMAPSGVLITPAGGR